MENTNKELSWFHSSSGNGSISLTLKSSLLGLIPIFVFILQNNGVAITENDVVEVVNEIVALVALVGVIIGTARKIYNGFKK